MSSPKGMSCKELSAMSDRLLDCETRLFEANGFLNVMNKALECDYQNNKEVDGYSSVLETVRGVIGEIVQEFKEIQADFDRRTNHGATEGAVFP